MSTTSTSTSTNITTATMTTTTTKDFDVAVIGGGMCGLTLAIALSQVGIHVDLYETAAKFGEIGAGFGLNPNAIHVLERLGLFQSIVKHSKQPVDTPHFHCVWGEESPSKVFYSVPVDKHVRNMNLHRSVFLDSLVPHLPNADMVHFNKRLVALSRDPTSFRYTLYFTDGTQSTADIVIGADGIRSIVRKFVLEGIPSTSGFTPDLEKERGRRRTYGGGVSFSGMRIYRGLIPMKKLDEARVKFPSENLMVFFGKGKCGAGYKIGSGTTFNVGFHVTDPTTPPQAPPLTTPWTHQLSTNETLLEEFSEWNDDLQGVLRNLPEPGVWAMHHMDPALEHYVRERVVLVGDAAHASTPFMGAGAAAGFEDILFLRETLGHPQTTRNNVETVLQQYDLQRPPRGAEVISRSIRTGRLYQSCPDITEETLKEVLTDSLHEMWSYDVEATIDESLIELRRSGVFTDVDSA